MIADMADAIGGKRLAVESFLPIGADPHTYEPTPSDARRVRRADLILKNGLKLEGWINKLVANSGTNARVVTVSQGIEPIRSAEYENAPDPHAWMDPLLGIRYARNIMAALQQLDPAGAEAYRRNFEQYRQRLRAVHETIQAQIAKIPKDKRVLITSHDAFRYFARRYGLRVHSVMGISTDAEAQAGNFQQLIETIERTGVPAVFVESTINPKMMQQISRDHAVVVGGELYADSMGKPGSGAGSYVKMLRHNARTITGALLSVGDEGLGFEIEYWGFLGGVTLLFGAAFGFVAYRLRRRQVAPPAQSYQLAAEGITVSYDRKLAITDIYLTLQSGKLYGLIGGNGSGKSTLIKTLLGLIAPDGGTVQLNGQAVERFRERIAYIPQREEIDWDFPATVEDIVLMGRYPHLGVFQALSQADYAHAEAAMQQTGIYELRNQQIGQLSGGQQQRAFIARALCQQADILLLDEPFVGVDVATEATLIELLKAQRDAGKLVLVIHHDLSKVAEYFDELILLNQHIVAAGPVSEVFTDENLKRTYGGQLQMLQQSTAGYAPRG
jgi:ABC-type Mn2+/Zn2+ transport system ATPase subunit/ABC-type Zn uptake system ZnuABC Zn-binding protein ZnuA